MSSTTWRVSFSRARAVEPRAPSGTPPRRAHRACRARRPWLARRRLGLRGSGAGGRRRLLQQTLQHAARFLAAGHAQVELGFRRRRRWPPSRSRTGSRTGRSPAAPWRRTACAAAACPRPASCARRSAWPRRARARRRPRRQRLGRGVRHGAVERRGAGLGVERQQAGEEAVEPGALLGRERRASPGS